jgi:hypothetical protein
LRKRRIVIVVLVVLVAAFVALVVYARYNTDPVEVGATIPSLEVLPFPVS